MDLKAQIENMFDEIESYGGDFGDPIATEFSFNPLNVLRDSEADDWLKCGASIALLVNFCVAADNSTYRQALTNNTYQDIEFALENGLCNAFPVIVRALLAANRSESEFYDMLRQVYIHHVENWRQRGHKA